MTEDISLLSSQQSQAESLGAEIQIVKSDVFWFSSFLSSWFKEVSDRPWSRDTIIILGVCCGSLKDKGW